MQALRHHVYLFAAATALHKRGSVDSHYVLHHTRSPADPTFISPRGATLSLLAASQCQHNRHYCGGWRAAVRSSPSASTTQCLHDHWEFPLMLSRAVPCPRFRKWAVLSSQPRHCFKLACVGVKPLVARGSPIRRPCHHRKVFRSSWTLQLRTWLVSSSMVPCESLMIVLLSVSRRVYLGRVHRYAAGGRRKHAVCWPP